MRLLASWHRRRLDHHHRAPLSQLDKTKKPISISSHPNMEWPKEIGNRFSGRSNLSRHNKSDRQSRKTEVLMKLGGPSSHIRDGHTTMIFQISRQMLSNDVTFQRGCRSTMFRTIFEISWFVEHHPLMSDIINGQMTSHGWWDDNNSLLDGQGQRERIFWGFLNVNFLDTSPENPWWCDKWHSS